MVNVNELRVGNLLLTSSGTIVPIRGGGIAAIESGQLIMHPIPLTPEWLERMGWQVVDQGSGPYYWLEKQCWFHIHLSADGSLYANFNNNTVLIKSLHHLQNIYLDLTGEQLTINNEHLQSTS